MRTRCYWERHWELEEGTILGTSWKTSWDLEGNTLGTDPQKKKKNKTLILSCSIFFGETLKGSFWISLIFLGCKSLQFCWEIFGFFVSLSWKWIEQALIVLARLNLHSNWRRKGSIWKIHTIYIPTWHSCENNLKIGKSDKVE
jgi:hypothetical protein